MILSCSQYYDTKNLFNIIMAHKYLATYISLYHNIAQPYYNYIPIMYVRTYVYTREGIATICVNT